MRLPTRKFFRYALVFALSIWTLLASGFYIFWHEIYARMWVLIVIPEYGIWGSLALLMACGVAIFAKDNAKWFVGFVLTVWFIIAVFFFEYGQDYGNLIRFRMFRQTYERTITNLVAGGVPLSEVNYIVDQSAPLRVAFPWPGGIGDNWSGVVYDRSGTLAKLRGRVISPQDRSALARSGSGLLVELWKVEALDGDWFFCYFS